MVVFVLGFLSAPPCCGHTEFRSATPHFAQGGESTRPRAVYDALGARLRGLRCHAYRGPGACCTQARSELGVAR